MRFITYSLKDKLFQAETMEELERQVKAFYYYYDTQADVSLSEDKVVACVDDDVEGDQKCNQAASLANRGKMKDAEKIVDSALKKHPLHAELNRFHGQFLMLRNDEKAEEAILLALRCNPNSISNYVVYGNIIASVRTSSVLWRFMKEPWNSFRQKSLNKWCNTL